MSWLRMFRRWWRRWQVPWLSPQWMKFETTRITTDGHDSLEVKAYVASDREPALPQDIDPLLRETILRSFRTGKAVIGTRDHTGKETIREIDP